MKYAPILVVLAMSAVGCVTQSTVTDGDRQVTWQNIDAAAQALDEILDVAAAVDTANRKKIEFAAQALVDIKANSEQLRGVHGPAEIEVGYTPENSDKARKQSQKDHETSTFSKVAVGLLSAAGGVAAAWFGMPWLAGVFPKLTGKIGVVAQNGIEIITSLRKKAEEGGGSITAKDILKIANEYNVSAGVKEFVNKKATAFEESLGFDPKVKLEDKDGDGVPDALEAVKT